MLRRVGLAAFGLAGLAAIWLTGGDPAPAAPRDRPMPAAPAGLSRVVALGTSLTHRPGWTAPLAERLSTCLGHPVTIETIARPGASSAWGREQIGRVLEAKPDLVLIEFAINDADIRDGLSLAESRMNHAAILGGLRAARPDLPIVLMTMNPAYGLRGWIRPRLGRYYALYPEFAGEFDTGLVDLYPRWLALPRDGRGLAADGLHPEAAASAALVAPTLATYLGAAMGQDCEG